MAKFDVDKKRQILKDELMATELLVADLNKNLRQLDDRIKQNATDRLRSVAMISKFKASLKKKQERKLHRMHRKGKKPAAVVSLPATSSTAPLTTATAKDMASQQAGKTMDKMSTDTSRAAIPLSPIPAAPALVRTGSSHSVPLSPATSRLNTPPVFGSITPLATVPPPAATAKDTSGPEPMDIDVVPPTVPASAATPSFVPPPVAAWSATVPAPTRTDTVQVQPNKQQPKPSAQEAPTASAQPQKKQPSSSAKPLPSQPQKSREKDDDAFSQQLPFIRTPQTTSKRPDPQPAAQTAFIRPPQPPVKRVGPQPDMRGEITATSTPAKPVDLNKELESIDVSAIHFQQPVASSNILPTKSFARRGRPTHVASYRPTAHIPASMGHHPSSLRYPAASTSQIHASSPSHPPSSFTPSQNQTAPKNLTSPPPKVKRSEMAGKREKERNGVTTPFFIAIVLQLPQALPTDNGVYASPLAYMGIQSVQKGNQPPGAGSEDDFNRPMCAYELNGGLCNDDTCKDRHFKDL
ncbi:hypothetical protein DM01DRAFT_1333215 [Hesseltinella vesiculosa]|uniref:Putative zinc-finger domain-containing protein n=1 Tax=Hesseltinella vesiculosa TaxID=101127 RepID=A0A1X2GRQ9_9FUNG|nr:hypothetical protein DM01DRAFT_1333215 [Hesseltinella vesiculosa]